MRRPFNSPDLLAWMDRHSSARSALALKLAGLVRQGHQRIGEHALLSVKERLFYALINIAEREGERDTEGDAIVFTRRRTRISPTGWCPGY